MTEKMGWNISIQKGSGAGKSMELGQELSIGREIDNNLVINEPKASRRHAVIRQQGGSYILIDQGSSNGTFLNGQLVAQPTLLKNGDRIMVGDTEILISDPKLTMLEAQATMLEAQATMLEPQPTPPVASPPVPPAPVVRQTRPARPSSSPGLPAIQSSSAPPLPVGRPVKGRRRTPIWVWLAGIGAIVVVILLAIVFIGGAGVLGSIGLGRPSETEAVAASRLGDGDSEQGAIVNPTDQSAADLAGEQSGGGQTQPAELTATPPPPPTETPLPPPTATEAPPPTPDMAALMQGAEILLFEDIAGAYLNRHVKQALDNGGYQYTDLKDRVGDFKTELLSGKPWDLIIVAVEARSAVQGEFFDYINTHLTDGVGVIIEIWNLDKIGGGRASQVLSRCGVAVQSDWNDPPNRSVMWLVPEHPIFHQPNEGVSLVNYSPYWVGDAGDLLRKTSGSDAVLLGGTIATEKDRYGTLVSCMDGRLIIQTHSSHDYRAELIVPLWENYIDFTLRSHFEALQ
jgi:pSer/pThr/pTyr-binding forkhead associated (FHA) protein